MRVVQALHWLRGALSKPEDRPQIMGRLHSILTRAGEGAAIAADLRQGLTTLPAWMHVEKTRDNWQAGPWDRVIQARGLAILGQKQKTKVAGPLAGDDHF